MKTVLKKTLVGQPPKLKLKKVQTKIVQKKLLVRRQLLKVMKLAVTLNRNPKVNLRSWLRAPVNLMVHQPLTNHRLWPQGTNPKVKKFWEKQK